MDPRQSPTGDRDARGDRPAGFAQAQLPTKLGVFQMRVYRAADGTEPVAVISGDVRGKERLPVRVHSACFTSENLGSLRCDCREQLDFALGYIAREGGVVVYLHQEGRGIGLAQKIRAYALQESGYDTLEANCALGLPEDARTYETAASILQDLGVRSIELITNNPDKIQSLICLGIKITGRIPVVIPANHFSAPYLETKFTRMRHIPGGNDSLLLDRQSSAND
ncbi:MAG TPA: GTP cyclohydrolase II [Verrucomicrobiae bacterium]|nr:GTP cyclohydrolase II [Verrucomicrobiae bacterium]